MRIIDCRGACPNPVETTRKTLAGMSYPVEIKVDRPDAVAGVSHMLGNINYRYQTVEESDYTRIIVTGKELDHKPKVVQPIWLITSSTLGQGSAEQGLALMKSVLQALSHTEASGTIYFLNSGVKLCAGPQALPAELAALVENDWELRCSGPCLDYFSLKGQVKLGTVADIDTMVQDLQQAAKVISL